CRVGDLHFQSRVFRTTIVVDARDDSADGHDRSARGRDLGGTRRIRRSDGRGATRADRWLSARSWIQLYARAGDLWVAARARVHCDWYWNSANTSTEGRGLRVEG